MNEHQKLAILALEYMKGDDFYRIKRAFEIYSPEEMKKQHGASGQTREEILKEYESHEQRCIDAINWIKSL